MEPTIFYRIETLVQAAAWTSITEVDRVEPIEDEAKAQELFEVAKKLKRPNDWPVRLVKVTEEVLEISE
jgi:hypothetical protein